MGLAGVTIVTREALIIIFFTQVTHTLAISSRLFLTVSVFLQLDGHREVHQCLHEVALGQQGLATEVENLRVHYSLEGEVTKLVRGKYIGDRVSLKTFLKHGLT